MEQQPQRYAGFWDVLLGYVLPFVGTVVLRG